MVLISGPSTLQSSGPRAVVGDIAPPRVLKYATHVAMEVHNISKEQNSVRCEEKSYRLSMDMPMFLE